MTPIPLLVRTPAQFQGESPLGFVLRASEMNGYETPRHIFSLAKATRNESFTVAFDMTKIAGVLGRSPDTLTGYRATGETDTSQVELGGHSLSASDLGLAMPGICPECVHEHGFVPAWTDLALVDACPRHKRLLLSVCPSCGNKLSWFRPGLLRCRCGADLNGVRGATIAAEHAALLSQVVAKVTGVAVDNPCDMPTAHFTKMTLRGLLGMARGLARFDQSPNKEIFWSVASSAGRLFSQWPGNLYLLLRELLPSDAMHSGAVVMRRYFKSIYRIVLRDVTAAEDIAFFRDSFVAFSPAPEGSSLSESNRPVGKISPLPSVANPTISRPSRVCKKRPTTAPKAGERTFGERDAARRIGLPVSVLHSLRRSGHFEAHHTASRVAAFHEADIIAFETKVSALQAQSPAGRTDGLSLRKVLRMAFKFDDGKGEFVAAVLDGKISVIGSQEPGLRGLLLDKREADAFITKSRATAFGDAITCDEVGRMLHCDPMIVPSLIAAGHIAGSRYEAGLRIARTSVETFGAEYISVAAIAKERRTLSRGLIRQLSTAGVEMLNFKRGYGNKSSQPFIRIADWDKLGHRANTG